MPTGFEQIRQALAEARKAQQSFPAAWSKALALAAPEDRSALVATKDTWQECYERRSAT